MIDFVDRLQELINESKKIAQNYSSKYVHLEHVLYVVMKDEHFLKLFKKYKIDYKKITKELEDFISNYPLMEHIESSSDDIEISPHVLVFLGYCNLCHKCNEDVVINKDVLFITNVIASFLFMEETFSQKILLSNNVSPLFLTKIYQSYSSNMSNRVSEIINETLDGSSNKKEQLFLSQYTINLTEKVKGKEWQPLIGRDDELELLQYILLRHDKPNIILVGNHGVGKSKLVEGLAKIYSEKYTDKEFLLLDNLSFTANIMVKGEIENRVKTLHNILNKKENVVLIIDDIHFMCGNGDYSSQNDLSSLFKPMLCDGKIKIIGITTNEDYRRFIEKDDNFVKNFFKFTVKEPSFDETKNIIMNIKSLYENNFNVTFSEKIIDLIMDYCNRYFYNKFFPEKAIDILDTVGAYATYHNKKEISEDMIYKVLSILLGIPLNNISLTEEEIYKNLENTIKKEIIGQDEAVKKVSEAVIISKSGLRETNKTAISLMFKGSSGVGKTEICKVLSKILNIPLVRFDMSEYMEEHSVSKLLGAPPGYKGFGDGKSGNGLLINAIDEHPSCILLLDEIEKANSKIHNVLLQVMDNGKLTSSSGKSVSFEHVYLIMTSNVGSYNSHKIRIGFGNNDYTPSDQDYEDRFLPEFRNRIDSTVTFNNLSSDVLKTICIKFLDELKSILSKKMIDFEYNDDIINYIVKKVENSNNGARPMKHIITNEIKNVIAKDIVFGKYKNGGKILLKIKDNKIYFGE